MEGGRGQVRFKATTRIPTSLEQHSISSRTQSPDAVRTYWWLVGNKGRGYIGDILPCSLLTPGSSRTPDSYQVFG